MVKISSEQDIRNLSAGKSQFVVYSDDKSFFSLDSIKVDGTVLGVLNYSAIANLDKEKEKCYIVGTDKEEFLRVFKNDIENNTEVSNGEQGVVISRYMANKFSAEKGQDIRLIINDKEYNFKVQAITEDTNYFAENKTDIIIGKEQIDKIIHIDSSEVNRAFIYACGETTNIEDITLGKNQFIQYSVDSNLIDSNVMMYLIFFILILIFVLIIVIYILFSIYKTFILERAVYIGTLKTCGATPKDIKRIFIRGNNILAVISGIIGSVLGFVFIVIYIYLNFSLNYVSMNLMLVLISIVLSILFPVVVSTLCIIILLRKVVKNSDRLLVTGALNMTEAKVGKYSIGAVIALIAVYTINKCFAFNNMVIASLIFILMLVFAVMGIKTILYIFDLLFGRHTHRGILHIAMNNVIRNTYVQKNITIITIVSLLLILISVLSSSTVNVLSSFYYDYNCDAIVTSNNFFEDKDVETVRNIDTITDAYAISARSIIFNEVASDACYILSDPEEFSKEHLNLHIYNNDTYDNTLFNKDYNCIISKNQANRYDLRVGDTITIRSQDISQEYKVVALAGTMLEMGNAVIISDYNLPFNNFEQPSIILVKGNSEKGLVNNIKTGLVEKDINASLIQDKIEHDKKNSYNIFRIFYLFSGFIVLISLQGIYNNYKLSYIFRRKEFAVMISNGYTLRHILKILSGEVVICSIIGCLIGLSFSFIFKEPITVIMRSMDMEMPLIYNIQSVALPLFMCIAISLLSLLLSIKQLKSSKEQMLYWLKV